MSRRSQRRWRPLLLAAVAGVIATAATIGSAALAGMPGKEVFHLALLVLPPLALTVAVGGLAWKRDAVARERAVEVQRRDLITALSHDLRTPLASLRAMAEAIDEGVVDDRPTMRRYATEMRRSAESLGTLIDDLFELVQLEPEAIAAEARRATVEQVVSTALAACGGDAHRKGLRVETELNGVADAPCSPRLGRVLQNLVQNAIRHTPADGTVTVEADRGPGTLRLTVSDSGEGIPADSIDRVFEPFWRGDAARSTEGAGLGLALSKRIVESLGGEIEVRSDPSYGSRFAVLLRESGRAAQRSQGLSQDQ
jgi:signal transduction histidine kinase